jgi:hypothetical protein
VTSTRTSATCARTTKTYAAIATASKKLDQG